MEIIEFNKNNIMGVLSSGIESIVYFYKVNDEIILLKLFRNEIKYEDHVINIDESVLENKRKKIVLINNDPLFKDEVKTNHLVVSNGKFVGYTEEPYGIGCLSYFDKRKDKVEILKKLKEKIINFNKNNIYIGDFKLENFLTDENGIKLCDLDNFKIKDLNFDVLSFLQQVYLKKYDIIDNIDKFCFNLFTIAYLGKIDIPYIFSYLKEDELPKPIDSKRNYELLLKREFTEDFFIDNIK